MYANSIIWYHQNSIYDRLPPNKNHVLFIAGRPVRGANGGAMVAVTLAEDSRQIYALNREQGTTQIHKGLYAHTWSTRVLLHRWYY